MSYLKYIIMVAAIFCLPHLAQADQSNDQEQDSHKHDHEGCASWASATLTSVTEYGGKLTLNDDSSWRVDQEDAAIANNWAPNANIEICGDRKITNGDEGQSVRARQIK